MSEKPTSANSSSNSAGGGDRAAPQGDASPALPTELGQAQAEAADFKERWLRAQADYQNLRRRQQSDIDHAVRRTLESLLANLLTVVDHLDFALSAKASSEETRAFAQGVRQTRDQLLAILRQEGVQQIAHARAFDASQHQAVSTAPSSEHAPGEILDFLREGYTFLGHVLRPAQVRVIAKDPQSMVTPDQDA